MIEALTSFAGLIHQSKKAFSEAEYGLGVMVSTPLSTTEAGVPGKHSQFMNFMSDDDDDDDDDDDEDGIDRDHDEDEDDHLYLTIRWGTLS